MNEPEEWMPVMAGLKHVRKSRRMSQQRLADSVGVGAKYISRYETEELLPRLNHLKAICRALKCQLWQLFFDPKQHDAAVA